MLPIRVGGAVERIERTILSVGDYAVRFRDNSVPPCSIERKSMGDLYSSMTGGYARFRREIQRAKDTKTDLVLGLEDPLAEIAKGYANSKFAGESMVRKLFTLELRYRIRIVYCQNRFELARWIVEYFSAIGREHVRRRP